MSEKALCLRSAISGAAVPCLPHCVYQSPQRWIIVPAGLVYKREIRGDSAFRTDNYAIRFRVGWKCVLPHQAQPDTGGHQVKHGRFFVYLDDN